eukprot:g19954.t1
MARADAEAAASGISSFDLMLRAGYAVAASALAHYPEARRYAVLCGPGNNGGDGFVAASVLADSGAAVDVFTTLSDPRTLSGDADRAFRRWGRETAPLKSFQPAAGDLVIDAVFGAGLTRDVPEALARVIEQVAAAGLPVIAVDLPSGLCGRRGQALGSAFTARRTVTFMVRKPGHLLLPGRSLCGDIEVIDIGIPARIITAVAGSVSENLPSLWQSLLTALGTDTHKYKRGHLAVFSGSASRTGAARLTALAGLKSGAGLVTLASPADAMEINAAQLTAVMLREINDAGELTAWLEDARLSAFVLGNLEELLGPCPQQVPTRVLTPHEGEFKRLFPDLAVNSALGKVEKAVEAAARSHAVIVYKGGDTVIASPDGRACINAGAPPFLATAGSGDVLAGIIGALLADGVPAFEAAAAAVYFHGEAAVRAGEGMTSEDLVENIRVQRTR